MAIAINTGICAGAFAPTSLFGVITYRVAREAGIDVRTLALLAVAAVANLTLLVLPAMLFSSAPQARGNGTPVGVPQPAEPQAPAPSTGPLSVHQGATLVCLLGLVLADDPERLARLRT